MRRSLVWIWAFTVRAHASACSVSDLSSASVAGRRSRTSRNRVIKAKSSGSGTAGQACQMRSQDARRSWSGQTTATTVGSAPRFRPDEPAPAVAEQAVPDGHWTVALHAQSTVEPPPPLRPSADSLKNVALRQAGFLIHEAPRQIALRRRDGEGEDPPLDHRFGRDGRDRTTALRRLSCPGKGFGGLRGRGQRIWSRLRGAARRGGRACRFFRPHAAVERACQHTAREEGEAEQHGPEPTLPCFGLDARTRAGRGSSHQLLESSVLVQPGTFDPGQLGIDENEFGADRLQDSDEFSVCVPSSSAPPRPRLTRAVTCAAVRTKLDRSPMEGASDGARREEGGRGEAERRAGRAGGPRCLATEGRGREGRRPGQVVEGAVDEEAQFTTPA